MKNKLTTLAFASALALTSSQPTLARIEHLLPSPVIVTPTSDNGFALNRSINISSSELTTTALESLIVKNGGSISNSATATITVNKVASITNAIVQDEAYTLSISENAIVITATSNIGVIRAAQTMAQLALENSNTLEALTITDYPAFPLRGYMHDVGRDFISVEELKKQIDLLAQFKVNYFHWHLTDNQGWRIETKLYPQLTTNSYSRRAGKFYTQEQAKDIVAYCAERGIEVIPEIDMPGHSESFTRAMGFGMQTDQGVEALKAILNEMCKDVFTSCKYFHIGTDETTVSYPNFVPTMVAIVRESGKKCVSWHPGASYTNQTIDMLELWSSNGRKISGIPNIDTRYFYINHYDTYADIVGQYKSNIYYATSNKADSDVAGQIIGIWNDRATETETDIVKQNGLYASILAMADRAWKGGGKAYIEQGGTLLPSSSSDEFKEFQNWEDRFLYYKKNILPTSEIPYVKQTNIRWNITDAFPNGGNLATSFPPETDIADSYTYNGTTYNTSRAIGAGIYLRHTWGTLVPCFFKSPTTNSTAYAYTYVYSPKKQTLGAQIEFQNYGRSESDLAPEQGKWDDRGSRIWVNDKEILPPTWENTHTGRSNEITLKNENMAARDVIPVELEEGWNKVFLKLPVGNFSTNRVRLEKWGFTFALTNPEGTEEAQGIVYSPDKYINESTEALAEAINQAKTSRNSKVSDEPGYYPLDAASKLDAKIAELEATLNDETVPQDTRTNQITELNSILIEFETDYTSYSINMPKVSTATEKYNYSLSTPLRDNRFITAQSTGQALIGNTSASSKSNWQLVVRTDGKYDIVNSSDNSYISPASDYNTALKTSATQPTSGWSLSPGSTIGTFIVTSGTVEMNQTGSAQSYQIYNWGSGSNTTDTGCQYKFTSTDTDDIQLLSQLIATAKTQISSNIKNEVGWFPEIIASDLQKAIDDIEPTLTSELGTAKRNEQIETLQNASTAFTNSLATTPVVQPLNSDNGEKIWYSLTTPLRDSRFMTSQGASQNMSSTTTMTDVAKWSFQLRDDNTWDIINYDGSYIYPSADYISTSDVAPETGWTLKASSTIGYVVITNGSNQLNQGNGGTSYAIHNWGNGTNTSDTGCTIKVAYLSIEKPNSINNIDDENAQNDSDIYELDGRITKNPTKGKIYITNGKITKF